MGHLHTATGDLLELAGAGAIVPNLTFEGFSRTTKKEITGIY